MAYENEKVVGGRYLAVDSFTIPTVSLSDVSLQLPTSTNTTIANDCRRRQKWPPSAPHEALRSAQLHQMDG
jgi:hypothetical protein